MTSDFQTYFSATLRVKLRGHQISALYRGTQPVPAVDNVCQAIMIIRGNRSKGMHKIHSRLRSCEIIQERIRP
jgi:hypothetical protein